ncbi:pentapeptide repeat-containing protein [Hyphomicrobium sp.]|uniref:pentapeptide repeat-containing protein n=2 Tax=Hyphomicrobium sp. TaxID=82 RepID=UPI002D1FC0F2|nr:pentapeptide repeat-containing protein [Hyphomicrobium sp.]
MSAILFIASGSPSSTGRIGEQRWRHSANAPTRVADCLIATPKRMPIWQAITDAFANVPCLQMVSMRRKTNHNAWMRRNDIGSLMGAAPRSWINSMIEDCGRLALSGFLLLSLLSIASPVAAIAGDLDRMQVIEQIATAKPGQAPDLARRDLSGLDLSGIDFKGADLFAANLSGTKLSRANLAHANLTRAVLTDADLSGADLQDADMFAVMMSNANLSGANLSRARIIGGLNNARLDGAKLIGADLGFDPTNANMAPPKVDLSGAVLDGADLTDANLRNALLEYAKLRGARLVNTRLNWAKLAGADLSGADVAGADMSNADLTNAVLTGLKGANSASGLEPGAAR